MAFFRAVDVGLQLGRLLRRLLKFAHWERILHESLLLFAALMLRWPLLVPARPKGPPRPPKPPKPSPSKPKVLEKLYKWPPPPVSPGRRAHAVPVLRE